MREIFQTSSLRRRRPFFAPRCVEMVSCLRRMYATFAAWQRITEVRSPLESFLRGSPYQEASWGDSESFESRGNEFITSRNAARTG